MIQFSNFKSGVAPIKTIDGPVLFVYKRFVKVAYHVIKLNRVLVSTFAVKMLSLIVILSNSLFAGWFPRLPILNRTTFAPKVLEVIEMFWRIGTAFEKNRVTLCLTFELSSEKKHLATYKFVRIMFWE